MRRRLFICWLTAVGLTGCLHPVAEQTDRLVSNVASRQFDLHSALEVDPAITRGEPGKDNVSGVEKDTKQPKDAKAEKVDDKRGGPAQRLRVPADMPGAGSPRAQLPPTNAPAGERETAIDRLYPKLPPLGSDPAPCSGPAGQPLTLTALQQLAMTNSPVLRQEASDVEAARGAMIQAGLYPNPSIGWAQDEVGTAVNGPAELGMAFSQTFILGGKLTLARAVAQMDMVLAQLDLRRAQAELAGQVRSRYFAVLVAQENVRATGAMARFTDELYRVQVEQVKLATAAPYEPRQLRVFAMQARNSLIAARNRYVSAWKQLTATLGLPGMKPTQVAGRATMPVPVYQYDRLLDRVLWSHSDVLSAVVAGQKARYGLQKARVAPIPDVTLSMHVNKYFTENNYVHSLDVKFPIPVFDNNKGGIIQAQGGLVRANEESHRVRADLTGRLAEAFERYSTSMQAIENYRTLILTDQVEAYLGAYERHQQEPDKVTFGDVVASQQQLAGVVSGYLSTLGSLWDAVADLSTLLQTEDLFHGVETQALPTLPDFEQLVPLNCCHRCSPLSDARLQGADGSWPGPSGPGKLKAPAKEGEKPEILPPPRRIESEPKGPVGKAGAEPIALPPPHLREGEVPVGNALPGLRGVALPTLPSNR